MCTPLCTCARASLEPGIKCWAIKRTYILNRLQNKLGSRRGNKDIIMLQCGLEFPQTLAYYANLVILNH